MNEKDMLIYAAYACDYAFNGTHIVVDGQGVRWNPWQDTGDAVRVALHLQFDIECGQIGALVRATGQEAVLELEKTQPERAFRRAIVRMAARVGYAKILNEGKNDAEKLEDD